MPRSLGFLTVYGLEYIYDFIGEERINMKIIELQNVATMGTRFKDFIGGDINFSYYSGTGPLYIYSSIFNWFKDDLTLALFLYEKSKSFNEENYFSGGNLKSRWEESQMGYDMMVSRNPELATYWQSKKITPFWMEYHFFINTIVKILFKHRTDLKIELLLAEMFENYYENSEDVILRIKMDEILWSKGISNDIFMKMEKFYAEKENDEKVVNIRYKARDQGWRPFVFG